MGGAATGGLIGGAAGLLAGIGALAIPGLGPIVAAGPIAATLTGAVGGGLIAGWWTWGSRRTEASSRRQVRSGKVLAVVDAVG